MFTAALRAAIAMIVGLTAGQFGERVGRLPTVRLLQTDVTLFRNSAVSRTSSRTTVLKMLTATQTPSLGRVPAAAKHRRAAEAQAWFASADSPWREEPCEYE